MKTRTFPPFPFHDFDKSFNRVRELNDAEVKNGMCSPDEYTLLYELASGYHNKNQIKYIVEYGTCNGFSAYFMAQGLADADSNGLLMAVDPYLGNPHSEVASSIRNHAFNLPTEKGLRPRYICQVLTESECFRQFWHEPVQILFIDGEHSYEYAKPDLEGSLCFLDTDEAWVVMHDYDFTHRSIIQVAHEFIDNYIERSFDCFLVDQMLIIHLKAYSNEDTP